MAAPVAAHHICAGPARTAERRGRGPASVVVQLQTQTVCMVVSHIHTHKHTLCPVQHNNNLFTIFFFLPGIFSLMTGDYTSRYSPLIVVRQQTWRSVTRLGRGEVVLAWAGGWWGVTRECLVPAEEWTRLGWGQRAMWQRQPTDADGDPWKTSGVSVRVWGGGSVVGMGWQKT